MEWPRHILDYVANCQHRHEGVRERKANLFSLCCQVHAVMLVVCHYVRILALQT